MKKAFAILFALLALYTANAQEISITQGPFGGVKYTQNGELLTMAEVQQAMEISPEALRLIKKSKANNSLATVLSFAGGLLVGFPLGTAIGGGEPEWAIAGVGAGLIVLSIPISSKGHKHGIRAVSIYNATINSSYRYHFKPDLTIVSNSLGVGFQLRF